MKTCSECGQDEPFCECDDLEDDRYEDGLLECYHCGAYDDDHSLSCPENYSIEAILHQDGYA